MHGRPVKALATILLTALLAACGGGGESSSSGSGSTGALPANLYEGPAIDPPATKAAGARFLTQATFGPSTAEMDKLQVSGYQRWVLEQLSKPAGTPHQDYFAARTAELDEDERPSENWIYESFWRTAVTADDQLRHRVAFALSQIFVISLQDPTVAEFPRGVANYMDMLGRNAFGNFRTLLEDVSLHPMMGLYLTHLRNRKADPAVGRVPDENYAREIMQLFTIGLYQLNQDGTVKLDSRNEPIDTYKIEDVVGLARVFTGFSWAGPDASLSRFVGTISISDRDILPMRGYPVYHETGPKTFLGTTVTASTPEESLKQALDHLFMHPNVGPFFAKLMIQRMITSNPSPAYVSRVANVFNNNGQGVRGDMKAVVYAILLDPEARDDAGSFADTAGKLREPVLRTTAWLRAFGAKSTTGRFLIGATDDPSNSIGQSPMRAPSVFNFYRSGYVPPNTTIATSKLVAPEMQTTHEISVAGWLNTIRNWVPNGMGANPPMDTKRDVQPDYTGEIALADNGTALVDRVALLLTADRMPAAMRQQIVTAVNSINVAISNPTNLETARRNRVYLAVFLTLASPEFLVQK
ncbi:MAG TPA: DUF1800 domain-containing protein [Burkholderiaceae bacterium]|nr:DUF1800 domain-containing protein [Burkholderiaceae bacterium]